jgi:Fuc2NAc and GlcNAc transferase
MAFLLSLLLTALILPLLRRAAPDVPNDRSSHRLTTPRAGGIGFVSVYAGLAAAGRVAPEGLLLVPLALVGLLDDLRGLSVRARLSVQGATAVAVSLALFGAAPATWLPGAHGLGSLMGVLLVVILVNLYNFMDGIDGLVAGCTVIQLVTFGVEGSAERELAAALAAFLLLNWNPARVFMGDVGSTFLGGFIALRVLQEPGTAPSIGRLAVTLPLIGDGIVTLVRRVIGGENPLRAHREHLYQRLVRAGMSHRSVALLYMGCTAGCAWSTFGVRADPQPFFAILLSVGMLVGGEVYLSVLRARGEGGTAPVEEACAE